MLFGPNSAGSSDLHIGFRSTLRNITSGSDSQTFLERLDRAQVLGHRKYAGAELRVVPIGAMRLTKVFPNHKFGFTSDSTFQWPATDLATLTAEHVNSATSSPITIRFELPHQVSIERPVFEKLRDDSSVPSGDVESAFLLKCRYQLNEGSAIDQWNDCVDRGLIVTKCFDPKTDCCGGLHLEQK